MQKKCENTEFAWSRILHVNSNFKMKFSTDLCDFQETLIGKKN